MKIESGQVAAITGGASGIGLAIAEALAERGVKLAIGDIEQSALDAVVPALEAKGVEVAGDIVDVSVPASVARWAESVKGRFGVPNMLFNNAGVGGGGTIADTTLDDWHWVLGVNLNGVVYCLNAFYKDMIESGKPCHVVNTASAAGLICEAMMGPYNASKYAVVAISETMAREAAESNVGVSVLCPGFVDTKIGESARNAPTGKDLSTPPSEMAEFLDAVLKAGQQPEQTAAAVVNAIETDSLYILTHPDLNEQMEARFNAIRRAFP